MEHCCFEFWILVGFESWCDLGLPKEGREEMILRHNLEEIMRGVVSTL